MYNEDVKNHPIEMQCLPLLNVLNGVQCMAAKGVIINLKNLSTYHLPLSQLLKHAGLAYRSLLIV